MDKKLYGLMAEFDSATELVDAARATSDAGYRKTDAFSPFPIHDIDEALDAAAKHGCHPLRGVADYNGIYKLSYVRGPSGIIVMLAEELTKS